MTAQLGQVEHGEGAARCVHRVVRSTASLVEFVTRCDGCAVFGFPATTVALREQFRRKLVRFETNAGEAIARYITPEQLARRNEAPEQRRARAARARAQRAADFEHDARARLVMLNEADRAMFAPDVAAMVEAIRAGARRATTKARAALLNLLDTALSVQRASAHRPPRWSWPTTSEPREQPRPWFVSALALPAWPCDAQAIKRAFAARALATHPDHGGTAAAFIEVKRARDEALASAEWRAV